MRSKPPSRYLLGAALTLLLFPAHHVRRPARRRARRRLQSRRQTPALHCQLHRRLLLSGRHVLRRHRHGRPFRRHGHRPRHRRPTQRLELPPPYFGEGIVDWGPNLYEWTWQSHICFVYDRFSLRPVKQFSYSGEGWGMTRTARELITSDGTATLRFRDPATFKESHHIVVKDGPRTIDLLNELEYIHGEIYANVWHSDRIARISPRDGHVIAWIDLTGLLPEDQKIDNESVLNGIAYDALHDRLFVTGKQWPTIFEIKPLPSPTR